MTDKAYKDDVAPEQGSPFRPLYDDRIMFSGQPVALVVAEDSETARFAASLVRVEYEKEAHVTDIERQRDDAFAVEKPAKPRGDAAKALAAADCASRGRIFVPIEHHNPMEPYRFDGDRGTAAASSRSTTRRKACRTCSAMCAASSRLKPEDVRVMSPFVGGAFGSGLAAAVSGRAGRAGGASR